MTVAVWLLAAVVYGAACWLAGDIACARRHRVGPWADDDRPVLGDDDLARRRMRRALSAPPRDLRRWR